MAVAPKNKKMTGPAMTKMIGVLEKVVQDKNLTINALENEVKSLEGARKNLKDAHSREESANSDLRAELQVSKDLVSRAGKQRDQVLELCTAFKTVIQKYEAESALQLMKRAMRQIGSTIAEGASNMWSKMKSVVGK